MKYRVIALIISILNIFQANAQENTEGKQVFPLEVTEGSTVLFTFGQSNAANHGQEQYTPKNKVYNYCKGTVYDGKDPLVGPTGGGGSVWTRLADMMIDSGMADSVTITAIAVGATDIASWAEGGFLHGMLTESIDRNEKVFISISAQGGALVICDVSGKPLRPAISWLDRRAGEEARFLTESHGKDYYYERTGWRLNDGYNLAEILWLKRHEPDIYGQHPLYLSPLDWLTLKLTGKAVTDYTNLGITNLEDIRTLAWLDSIFGDLGIEEAQLPDVVAAGTPLGTLCAEACADLGLPDAIAVCGGYDQ